MSDFRSVVERTLHLQLQRFTHFRTRASLFAALVLSTIPFVEGVSSVSVASLAATLRKTLTSSTMLEGIPIINSLFAIFTRALNTVTLRVRIHVKIPSQWKQIFTGSRGCARAWGPSNDTYPTPRAEAYYWRVAGRYRRRLYSGYDVPSAPSKKFSTDLEVEIPLVTYYTPRLLPLYRDHTGDRRTSRGSDTTRESRITPKTFCKWHRMVFQDSCHPTLTQAAAQMKYYSSRDLCEIQRIARLLPDDQVFAAKGKGTRRARGTTKYREMWASWLENKGMDLVIVFE